MCCLLFLFVYWLLVWIGVVYFGWLVADAVCWLSLYATCWVYYFVDVILFNLFWCSLYFSCFACFAALCGLVYMISFMILISLFAWLFIDIDLNIVVFYVFVRTFDLFVLNDWLQLFDSVFLLFCSWFTCLLFLRFRLLCLMLVVCKVICFGILFVLNSMVFYFLFFYYTIIGLWAGWFVILVWLYLRLI